jgi:hypothetical protein
MKDSSSSTSIEVTRVIEQIRRAKEMMDEGERLNSLLQNKHLTVSQSYLIFNELQDLILQTQRVSSKYKLQMNNIEDKML